MFVVIIRRHLVATPPACSHVSSRSIVFGRARCWAASHCRGSCRHHCSGVRAVTNGGGGEEVGWWWERKSVAVFVWQQE
jgi:hypothetical protein